jgi:single-strand DNA-binding protein
MVTVIVGLLGSDPELRQDGSNNSVCNFSVAHNEKFKNRAGEDVSKTLWMRVSCWGKMAENAFKYLKKGSRVVVQGDLLADENGNPRLWTGNDGSIRSNFEMRAQVVRFAGQGGNGERVIAADVEEDDEIPF